MNRQVALNGGEPAPAAKFYMGIYLTYVSMVLYGVVLRAVVCDGVTMQSEAHTPAQTLFAIGTWPRLEHGATEDLVLAVES